MRRPAVPVLLFVILANLAVWGWLNRAEPLPPFSGTIRGVSFSPYQDGQSPLKGSLPSEEEIERDLALVAPQVKGVRSYSSTGGMEMIPRLAGQYGLRVTAGAWVDHRLSLNEQEIDNLIDNAQQYSAVERLIVGNEALLRGDLTVDQLIGYLRRVRAATEQPVTTAEPWHVWLQYPQLANEVDLIAIHVLPYWEGIPAETAVPWALERYRQVQQAFPAKTVIFGEVGWPSAGNRRGDAHPGRVNQAEFVRGFLNLAQEQGLDYFVMEAIDQPWKNAIEGTVGRHWGLFNAAREPKFDLVGEVTENRSWKTQAAFASLLALLPLLLFFTHFDNIRLRGLVFFAGLTQILTSSLAWTMFLPFAQDLMLLNKLVWGLLLPAQLALLVVVLLNGLELTEMLWATRLKRHFRPANPTPQELSRLPKVSIHLPIHNEPPEMVKITLDSLARLDYPDFEVLVIDNNTKDDAVWQPVQAYCEQLGPRFRFFHLPKWPGYKAGALNFALGETDPQVGVIGVIDSDYVVRPDWLRSMVPHFNERVAFVQAPQDHREWEGDAFKTMTNWEYNGFFQIGMVQRNERNAIIQHGTMTLIRRDLLEQARWNEHCICEDAELGLRLFAQGYEAVYVNEAFGRGVTPDSFSAYKIQRFRWAYGAVQILRKHWHALITGKGTQLTRGQRFHFLTGWLPWFADALHLMFTVAGVAWTFGLLVAPDLFEFPLAAFLIPTIGVFLFKVVHAQWLYRAKVSCTLGQRIGASIAGMGLTHTIARAMIQGLTSDGKPFFRTPKGENRPALIKGLLMAREESSIMLLLWLCGAAPLIHFGANDLEIVLWAAVLWVQSIPYLAALLTSLANSLPTLTTAVAATEATPAQVEPVINAAPPQPPPCGGRTETSPTLNAIQVVEPREVPKGDLIWNYQSS